jgi:GntR family transcriptional regulator
VERFKELIFKGVLEPDSQLPSVRNLAIDLSINPNTIQRAYTELEHQGYIYSVKGKGSFVAESKQLKQEKQKELLSDFEKLVDGARAIGITMEQLSDILHVGFEED